MGSPETLRLRLQAMNDFGGREVQRYVYEHLDENAQILDVGAGWGKYRNLLPDYEKVDACEIHLPYVTEERLVQRYRQVYCSDVTNPFMAARLHKYDLVIFGDVLEHLEVTSAQRILGECRRAAVVVPFLYEQGIEDGNQYEIHLQPDLTEEVMIERYPMLQLRAVEVGDASRDIAPKGFYVKEPADGN